MITQSAGLFDVEGIITGSGPWALAVVCAIIFIETGLLVGFLLPGDTLLVITGVLTYQGFIDYPIWLVCLLIGIAAFAGDQVGYVIGRRGGPAVFERKNSGFFSTSSVERTNRFFAKYGGAAVTIARFIGVVRTFAPVAAGVGKMEYRKFVFYNLLGALLWGVGLTLLGWGVAHIPGVADLVTHYIEWVLLGVIAFTIVAMVVHYLRMRAEARRDARNPRPVEIVSPED
ncbi:DedA family protein [Herbiconiux sp. SYSU D00978]|uniref:DedA family protein n=1 Tax=Herbiconiux sp. SYSU D00978 TaxID=2812562 RepID=UPI001A96604A|nr:DedA family protein [Herbiconiux sp. SYSU D00978]